MANQIYQIGYRINGEQRWERISSPDMESAERSWKHYRRNLNYTGFTIFNPNHVPAPTGPIVGSDNV